MVLSRFTHARYKYVEGTLATKLHSVDVWLPGTTTQLPPHQKWVVYIHGGAWRDPDNDSMALEPAFEILSALRFQSCISGFASINYRLSPYPDHPTNPNSPEDPSRNARHPDHVVDVSKALAYLEEKYKIGSGSGYLLVGHSAGATIAFQIQERCGDFKVPLPLGVLGVEGIYDLGQLVKTHEKISEYRKFVETAFGPNEVDWKDASPTSSEAPVAWKEAKAIIVAYSDQDELVDRHQVELMMERIRETPSCKEKVYYFPACGLHDEIWRDGHELARLIENALALI